MLRTPPALKSASGSSKRWLQRQKHDTYVRARVPALPGSSRSSKSSRTPRPPPPSLYGGSGAYTGSGAAIAAAGASDSSAGANGPVDAYRSRSSFKLVQLSDKHPVLLHPRTGGPTTKAGARAPAAPPSPSPAARASGTGQQGAASTATATATPSANGSTHATAHAGAKGVKGKDLEPKIIVDLGAAPGGWSQVAAAAVGRRGRVYALDILPMEDIEGVTVLRGDFMLVETHERLRRAIVDDALDARHLRARLAGADGRGLLESAVGGTVPGSGVHITSITSGPNVDDTASNVDVDVDVSGSGSVGAQDITCDGDGSYASGQLVDTVLSDMMGPMSGKRAHDVGMSLDLVVAAWEFARRTLKPARPGEAVSSVRGRQVWPGGNMLVKFFMHPDLDEFCKEVLRPRFGKVYIEKPKASRPESSEAYWVCQGFKG